MRGQWYGAMLAIAMVAGQPGAVLAGEAAASKGASVAPKLVVAISVDQFGGHLFNQGRGRYAGGLKRLADGGIVYANGYQSHAATETCPGHSTLLTGKHPYKTGVVANGYVDRTLGRAVYCLEDQEMRLAHDVDADPAQRRGPGRLLASTLGEWLKQKSPASRVVAVSGKDRGAINMAGHNPDGVFWYTDGFGFTTYVTPGADTAAALRPVAATNAALMSRWKATPPVWRYTDPQCQALERTWKFDNMVWPSQVPPVVWEPEPGFDPATDTAFNNAVKATPEYDRITLDAARDLIRHYRLGQGPAVDLLAVSLSATDYVGHRYGTQGPEMCDQIAQLDRSLGAFFADLDALGLPYLVVLSADHGGSDFPERLAERGYDAHRVDEKAWLDRINAALHRTLPAVSLAAGARDPQQLLVVDGDGNPLAAALKARAVKAALPIIRADAEVAAAFAVEEVLEAVPPRDLPVDEYSVIQRFALSTRADRSGDIQVAFKPYLTGGIPNTVGATISGHGSPWNYDRNVPILFWWPGVAHEERGLAVGTVDIAPTLAHVLGLTPPADVDGHCRDLGDFGTGACPK